MFSQQYIRFIIKILQKYIVYDFGRSILKPTCQYLTEEALRRREALSRKNA